MRFRDVFADPVSRQVLEARHVEEMRLLKSLRELLTKRAKIEADYAASLQNLVKMAPRAKLRPQDGNLQQVRCLHCTEQTTMKWLKVPTW